MRFKLSIFRVHLFLKSLLTITTLLLILLAITGQIVRDRTVEWGLLMYIPLLPLGLWTILLDLGQAGRALPRPRFGLTLIGLSLATWGSLSMIGIKTPQVDSEPTSKITFLHWNVRWGGKGKGSWDIIRQDITQRHPDIMVLSETPSKFQLNQLVKSMGPQWNMIMYEETQSNPLAVCSSGPLQFEQIVKIRNGVAMTVVATLQNQSLRVLAVDGNRNMSTRLVVMSKQVLPRWRIPMLNDIVQFLITSHNNGQPVDIIAGDFNAISHSLGFDAFAHASGGYHLASQFSHHWRGTWKSYLPLYDLDHIWLHKRFQIVGAKLFTNLVSDHRGQLVQFAWSS